MSGLNLNLSNVLIGHQNPIYSVVLDQDGKSFYTGGNDRGVVQWDLEKKLVRQVIKPIEHTIYCLYTVPNSSILVVGMRDGGITLISTEDAGIVQRLTHHTKPVFAVSSLVTPAGRTEMIVVSADGTATVWGLGEDGASLLYDFRVSDTSLRCLAISPDHDWIAFGSKDGHVNIYRAEDYSFFKRFDAHTMPVTSLAFSPDGTYLLTGGRDAQLNVFRTSDFSLEKTFIPHLFTVYAIAYHPVLPIFATASRDKSIKIWSAIDFRLLRILSREKGFDAHKLSINDLIWNQNGTHLISIGDDKLVVIWDLYMDEALGT